VSHVVVTAPFCHPIRSVDQEAAIGVKRWGGDRMNYRTSMAASAYSYRNVASAVGIQIQWQIFSLALGCRVHFRRLNNHI